MILVIGPNPPDPAGAQIVHRRADTTAQVLALLEETEYTHILVQSKAIGVNPFSLARHVRRTGGPTLVLVGPVPGHQQFWIERCGGRWAADMQTAMNFGEEDHD